LKHKAKIEHNFRISYFTFNYLSNFIIPIRSYREYY